MHQGLNWYHPYYVDILNSINYQNKEEIAGLYEVLAGYYESFGDYEKEIQALKKKWKCEDIEEVKEIIRRVLTKDMVSQAEVQAVRKRK